jgi:hypothetical protein
MNKPVPARPMIKPDMKSNWKRNSIANKKTPNMKAAMNIEVPIASFNSDSRAKRNATPLLQLTNKCRIKSF